MVAPSYIEGYLVEARWASHRDGKPVAWTEWSPLIVSLAAPGPIMRGRTTPPPEAVAVMDRWEAANPNPEPGVYAIELRSQKVGLVEVAW